MSPIAFCFLWTVNFQQASLDEQGLQLYARAHALVSDSPPVQRPQRPVTAARRLSGIKAPGSEPSGAFALKPFPFAAHNPSAAQGSPGMLGSRPVSGSAVHSARRQPREAVQALSGPPKSPSNAAGAAIRPSAKALTPVPRPSSAGAWVSQPLPYPARAAALVHSAGSRCREPYPPLNPVINPNVNPGMSERLASPAGHAWGHAHGSLHQGHSTGHDGRGRSPNPSPSPGLLCPGPHATSGREAALPLPGRLSTAPGALMSARPARSAGTARVRGAPSRRAATAAESWRDPAHRCRIDRIRRNMLCAAPGTNLIVDGNDHGFIQSYRIVIFREPTWVPCITTC